MNIILGIETSCDETASAVVAGGNEILSSVVSSQVELHSDFGGVVPEVASRAHLELLLPVIKEATKDTPKPDAIAATDGPGLIGALLVGVSAAKALALAWGIPYVGVNHLKAHLYATFLEEAEIQLPMVVLLVSGGHTLLISVTEDDEMENRMGFLKYEILGETLDDAAGEAFDKTARALGLGYPGGPLIDKLALTGNPLAVAFPRPMLKADNFDFSFSGLKTAVVNYLRLEKSTPISPDSQEAADIAASFQASVVDVLSAKTMSAVKEVGAKAISVAGGVAANSELRERLKASADQVGIPCYLASKEMCTDNAAMVAAAGWWQIQQTGPSAWGSSVDPSATLT